MKVTEKNGFYSVKIEDYERHFFSFWETMAFISNIDLLIQKN